jgi:hypothetical protein
MKRTIIAFFTALLFPLLAYAGSFEANDMAKITGLSYVHVTNAEPIWNTDRMFTKGDSCYLRDSGFVMILYENDGLYHVEYAVENPQSHEFCPTGATFFVHESNLK